MIDSHVGGFFFLGLWLIRSILPPTPISVDEKILGREATRIPRDKYKLLHPAVLAQTVRT